MERFVEDALYFALFSMKTEILIGTRKNHNRLDALIVGFDPVADIP